MYCIKCGIQLPENVIFCMKCGTRQIDRNPRIYVLRISGSPIEAFVETNDEKAIKMCKRLHSEHNLNCKIIEAPEQAERRRKPGMVYFYVKGSEMELLNLKESITFQLLMDGWKMQPATSMFVREE